MPQVILQVARSGNSVGTLRLDNKGLRMERGGPSLQRVVARLQEGMPIRTGFSTDEEAWDGYETVFPTAAVVGEIERILLRLGFEVKSEEVV